MSKVGSDEGRSLFLEVGCVELIRPHPNEDHRLDLQVLGEKGFALFAELVDFIEFGRHQLEKIHFI